MRMKKLLTFLTLLTLFFGIGWAETYTHTFATGQVSASGGNVTLSNVSWTASEATFIGFTNSALQIGSKNNPQTTDWTLKTSAFSGTITEVKINAWTGGAGTYAISVGGTSYKSGNLATSSTDITATGNSSGEVVISMKASSKAMYLKSITVTYTTGGSQATSHDITYAEVTGGTFTGPTSAVEGAEVTIQATPDDGYNFGSWNVTDASGAITVTDNKFTMGTSDVTVSGTFVPKPTYSITVTGVTCDPAAPTTAYAGDVVTLHPSIPEDKVVDWTATTVTPSTLEINHSDYSFTMPEADVTIAFALKDKPNTVDATFIFNTAAGLGNLGIYIPETPSTGTEIAGTTYKSGDVSFVATDGNPKTQVFLSSQEKLDLRVYTGGTFTISVPEGSKITNIEFTSENGNRAVNATNLSVTTGSMGNNMWTATSDDVSTVTFSANNQVRIYTITVSYIAGEAPDVVEYYLAGNLNGWGNPVDPAYKFVEQQDGSFVLNKVLPDMENADNIRFKIAKVVNGGTPVMLGANRSGDDYGINWNNHTDNFELSSASDAAAFSLSDLFNTTFTLNATATSFTVNKPQLFLVGTFNSYATPNNSSLNGAIEMTPAENGGWTLTHEFTDETEFRLYDAWHEYHGGNGAWFLEELLGTEFNINNDNDKLSIFHIVGDGNYTITVNSDITKLVADRVQEKYSATIASGINGGSVSFNANSQVSKLNDLPAGYTVNVFVNPQNEDWQLATLTYTAEGSTDAIDITATDGQYSFPMPAANVTINATFNYIGTATLTTYRRITSTDDLEVGKKYLIVNEEYSRAQLSGTENSAPITISNHETTVSSDSGIGEFVLGSQTQGYYTFLSGGKYLANSGSTSYDIVTTLSDNCNWEISFTEPDNNDVVYATIKAKNYNRIVYYFNGTGRYFRTYSTSNYSSNVQLYKEVTEVTPEFTEVTLAELCATGVTTEGSNKYVISDMLQAVYADDIRGLLWCKDLGNKSISSTSMHEGDQVDFLKNDSQAQNGRDWDQSNWILLSFSTPDMENGVGQLVNNARDKFIKPGTIKGTLVNNTNYTLEMELDQLDLVTQADAGYSEEPYEENVYCPSNFLPENLNIWGSIEAGDGAYTGQNPQNYFFMNPKVQEVCYITYAEWNQEKNCFTVPTKSPKSGFKGAFQVGWVYKTTQQVPTLQDGEVYNFHAVVQRSDKEHYGPNNPISAKDELPYSEYITVLPVDLTGDDNIITAINTVEAGKGEVKSVKYVNVAGVVSDVPFQGVNIVVTEYTDGTRTTSKMLRK